MGAGIGLCVAGCQGEQVRVSLGEAWVITVQKEQTRQSREVGGTGDGSEGRCWAGSLGLVLRVVGTPGAMCGGRALGQCGGMAPSSQPWGKWVGGVLSPGGSSDCISQDTFPGATGTYQGFVKVPGLGGGGFPGSSAGKQSK